MIIPGFPTPFIAVGASRELSLGTVDVHISTSYGFTGYAKNSFGSMSNNILVRLGGAAFDVGRIESFNSDNSFNLLCGDSDTATIVLAFIQNNATWLQATDLSWKLPTSSMSVSKSDIQALRISGYADWTSSNDGQTKTMEWA